MLDPETSRNLSEVLKKIPIGRVYEDLAQPSIQVAGDILGKLCKMAALPISALYDNYEPFRKFLANEIAFRLANIQTSSSQIVSPHPYIAGPLLQAMYFGLDEEELRNMFLNLLATSMDSVKAGSAHPAFVSIIQQLTPDEAKLLRYITSNQFNATIDVALLQKDGGYEYANRNFSLLGNKAECVCPEQTPAYIDNLIRLGIIESPPKWAHYKNERVYDELINHPRVIAAGDVAKKFGGSIKIEKRALQLTELGRTFSQVCLVANEIKIIGGAPIKDKSAVWG